VRIRELVLPSPDRAGFHPPSYGATRLRFGDGPAVCSHFAVNVAPHRFDEAVAWARRRVDLLEDDVPFPAWRARAAYFFDPAGNLVELIARQRAPGDELFLEISEVGLPVEDVAEAVAFFEAELGVPHFSGDRENFSAVGDDRGLFILVPVGRHWLFTEEPATDAPVRVTIDAAGPARRLVVPGSGHVVKLGSG
jgi:catechol 2,3-dioxygenase-like lactoylglutathione lyase family enzyme